MHVCMHGNYNFNTKTMDPLGTKVLIHTHSDERVSWELNGEPCWCVGSSPNHYRCVKCYVPRTSSIVHSDSVEFFPHVMLFPSLTMQDYLQQSVVKIVSIL